MPDLRCMCTFSVSFKRFVDKVTFTVITCRKYSECYSIPSTMILHYLANKIGAISKQKLIKKIYNIKLGKITIKKLLFSTMTLSAPSLLQTDTRHSCVSESIWDALCVYIVKYRVRVCSTWSYSYFSCCSLNSFHKCLNRSIYCILFWKSVRVLVPSERHISCLNEQVWLLNAIIIMMTIYFKKRWFVWPRLMHLNDHACVLIHFLSTWLFSHHFEMPAFTSCCTHLHGVTTGVAPYYIKTTTLILSLFQSSAFNVSLKALMCHTTTTVRLLHFIFLVAAPSSFSSQFVFPFWRCLRGKKTLILCLMLKTMQKNMLYPKW